MVLFYRVRSRMPFHSGPYRVHSSHGFGAFDNVKSDNEKREMRAAFLHRGLQIVRANLGW